MSYNKFIEIKSTLLFYLNPFSIHPLRRLFMAWFATLLAHLLVLFLIVTVPLRGQRRYEALRRRIERRPESGTEERLKFYKNGILGQWLMMVPLAVIIFGLGWSPQTLGLQAPSN